MEKFSGKTVLVTGSRGRLGSHAAALIERLGGAVIGLDLPGVVEEPSSQVHANGSCEIAGDGASEEDISALVVRLNDEGRHLDGVLQTTYTQAERTLEELTLDEWNAVLHGCLTSTFLICKYLLPFMGRNGGGVFVATSSVLAHVPRRCNGAYGAAKAGVTQLTRVAAVENAPRGVRCIVLEPGDFKTQEQIDRMSSERRATIQADTLSGRSALPEEIANAAVFLLSEASSYVNGSVFTVDGGFSVVS